MPDHSLLLAQARAYDALGDVYNAVKLYKRCIKLAPEQVEPYIQLAEIYKKRAEWKPALHYAKKALSLDASLSDTWWTLGITAVALGKARLAHSVWSKFGPSKPRGTLISLQLTHSGIFELIWAKPLDQARAQITSIPHPDSDRHFLDIVLFDRQVIGYNVAKRRRYPVHAELGVQQRSSYFTFSCWLESPNKEELQSLERLCADAHLGIEVWSKAAKAQKRVYRDELQEFYSGDVFQQEEENLLVAIAAKQEAHVEQVLRAWTIITLKQYEGLERH
jgi:tetratricopeptide (TPR) repeat protein